MISKSRRLKRLPNIRELWIHNILEGDRNVQDFLLNVAPLALENFEIEGDWNKNILNVSFYLDGLHAVLKSTTIKVDFRMCIRD